MKKGKLLLFVLLLLSFFTVKVNAKGYIGHTVHFDEEYEKKYVTDEDKARIMEAFGFASWDGSVIVHNHDYDLGENMVSFQIDYSKTNLNSDYPSIEEYLNETGESDPYYYEDVMNGYLCVGISEYEYLDSSLFDIKRENGSLRFGVYPELDSLISYDKYNCGESEGFNDGVHYLRYYLSEEGLALFEVDGDSNTKSYVVFYEAGDNTQGLLNFKDGSETVTSTVATAIRDFQSNIYTVRKNIRSTSSLSEGNLKDNDVIEFKHSLGVTSSKTGYSSIKLLPTSGYSFSINEAESTFLTDDILYVTTSFGRFERDENGVLYLDGGMSSNVDIVVYGNRFYKDYNALELVDLGMNAFGTVTLPTEEDALVDLSYYDPSKNEFVENFIAANFVQVTYHTMTGQEIQYFYTYDTDENRSLFDFESVEMEQNNEVFDNFVFDVEEKMTLSVQEMKAIIKANQYNDIEIRTNDGVSFTFSKGTMSLVSGITNYDFRVSIERDYNKANVSSVDSDKFIEKISYNYSGKLPAPAKIKIYADTGYLNRKVQYGLYEDGTIKNAVEYVVDGSGYVTVTQDHCSDYVLMISDGSVVDDPNPPTPTEPQGVRGDFSGDGSVNFSDVVVGLRKVFGYVSKAEDDTTNCDLNHNGELDFSDIVLLLRFVFGYITEI